MEVHGLVANRGLSAEAEGDLRNALDVHRRTDELALERDHWFHACAGVVGTAWDITQGP